MAVRMSEIKEALEEHLEANKEMLDLQAKKIEELSERLELIEADGDKPARTTGSVKEREQLDHVKVFCNWMRKPDDATRKMELENIEQHLSRKAESATIATPSSGGYAVPEVIMRDIEKFEKAPSPVRDLVKVVQISTPSSSSTFAVPRLVGVGNRLAHCYCHV